MFFSPFLSISIYLWFRHHLSASIYLILDICEYKKIMLEIKPKLKDQYAMHIWSKKLQHFVGTIFHHVFTAGSEKCHKDMITVLVIAQKKKGWFPFSEIQVDHLVEPNLDFFLMTRNIMLVRHIYYWIVRKLNRISSKRWFRSEYICFYLSNI